MLSRQCSACGGPIDGRQDRAEGHCGPCTSKLEKNDSATALLDTRMTALESIAIERAAEVVELWIFTNHERDTQQACAAAIRALKDQLL